MRIEKHSSAHNDETRGTVKYTNLETGIFLFEMFLAFWIAQKRIYIESVALERVHPEGA